MDNTSPSDSHLDRTVTTSQFLHAAAVTRLCSAIIQNRWYTAIACATGIALAAWLIPRSSAHPAADSTSAKVADGESTTQTHESNDEVIRVEVVTPERGGLGRKTIQPGSVHAFQYAELFSKVSGYLGEQHVDIGDHVARGQVLAVISVPELERDVEEAVASVERAKSVIDQSEMRVRTREAEADAATANVKHAEADLVRANAQSIFRAKELKRMQELYAYKSIERRLVDEQEDAAEAARAANLAAEGFVDKSKADAKAANARVDQAKTDVQHAKADLDVARAKLAKQRELLKYTRIESPYDGIVTMRKYHPGAFVRAADQGGDTPLLTVARTDLVRVVVQVPDNDVPFTNIGDRAVVEIDALENRMFEGKISRIADVENPQTRTMRVEIDISNVNDLLREGMYGRATIQLDPPSNAVVIPSAALVGKVESGRGKVFVASDGKAHLRSVGIGQDDARRMEVISGLSSEDLVIVRYRGTIDEGTNVIASAATEAESGSHH